MCYNIEAFYILREILLEKFVLKTFHIIKRVNMDKLRRKKRILQSLMKKNMIKTSKNSTFFREKLVKSAIATISKIEMTLNIMCQQIFFM